MHARVLGTEQADSEGYVAGRNAAWFAFAMTFALMVVDYVDRQVIVSLFPYLKAEWHLSDKALGGLVSVVSVVVALGAIPISLIADRGSRVKSIVVMATVWSLACIGCMFATDYTQLFIARALVGLGEAGYGAVGAALIASLFPARLRGGLLGAYFAAASLGSVLGVVLGGFIASRWGWHTAFGVVGVPGLVLALLYLKVTDYQTVALTPPVERAAASTWNAVKHIVATLARTRTLLWVCLGAAAQLVVVSAVWAWLPSYLNRYQGVAPDQAGAKAALVVLCGAVGSAVWGVVVDRIASENPRARMLALAVLVTVTAILLCATFHFPAAPATQFALICACGFVMTCTVGPVSAIVSDVVHPGVRATGFSVLSLFQNLLGLAVGPLIAGAFSDAWGLSTALSIIPAFGLLSAALLLLAMRTYGADARSVSSVRVAA